MDAQLDQQLAAAATRTVAALSTATLDIAGEPSVGLFRMQEHARSAAPPRLAEALETASGAAELAARTADGVRMDTEAIKGAEAAAFVIKSAAVRAGKAAERLARDRAVRDERAKAARAAKAALAKSPARR